MSANRECIICGSPYHNEVYVHGHLVKTGGKLVLVLLNDGSVGRVHLGACNARNMLKLDRSTADERTEALSYLTTRGMTP